jgi:hypothetical protein
MKAAGASYSFKSKVGGRLPISTPSARTRSRQLQARLFQRNRAITQCGALFTLGIDEASLRGLMRD